MLKSLNYMKQICLLAFLSLGYGVEFFVKQCQPRLPSSDAGPNVALFGNGSPHRLKVLAGDLHLWT
jgi:hypothetical protein